MNEGPINLNRMRKAKARSDNKARADENAAKFGQSKAEKKRNAAEVARAARHVDQHRREP